ncbi:tape measure protein [Psychrobacter sp. NZS113]|uniref:tape measure protein n=1 Tax=Psychrobacter sp. NZS113 TaxID=2792045 RepID=UPI0018CF85E7|nr:tape measure protein [Psychrobacter sp. NZS113]MBH0095954.1 tape measure protein [Psychrobacter sp. NZS113]
MAGDLDFSVQLRLLNENFNAGVNQARDRFSQFTESVERNLAQLATDTDRAQGLLTGLGNVSADRLTSEIKTAADQLRQMGAGANLTREQIDTAMQSAAQHVARLETNLQEARLEATRLAQTGASPRDLETAAQSVNRLEAELNQARSASTSLSNELAGAMNRASTSADNARNALYRMANIRVPETIRGEIEQINRTLVNFQQNSGRPAAEIERATRAAEEQIRRLERELNGVDDTIRRTDTSANNFSSNVGKLRAAMGGLAGLLAAAGIGIGAAEIIEMSDAFVTLEAKVKLATGEGAAFVTGFQGVTDIAKETFTSIENTGELFSRITQASESLGLAQSEILSVTKTINEAIKLSGGSAASADAAIIQLVQGLQSGVVRGEEFNSIMEQAPRLATAMADGLGVTKGELRAMAAAGKLTSEVVIEAVRSQTKTINDEFATLPTTFANSVQNMKTTVFELVGSLNETVNQSGRLAQGIQYISDAIDNIDPATMAAIGQSFDFVLDQTSALFTLVKDIYGAFSDLTSIISGTVAAGNDVGLITKLMQQFAVTTGVVIDGIRGLSIAADSVFGTISGIIGSVLIGIAKLNGETSTMGEALIAKQEELYARSEQKMMDFQSKSAAAWAEMNKTAQDRLDETVVQVVKNYDEMVAKGSYAAEAMEEQYIKVAEAKIAANDMIITDDMRLELAGQDLQASISETGELIIKSSKGVQAAYLGVGQSFAEVAIKAEESGTSMRESLTDAVPKAQTIGAVDDIISSLSALSSQGKISGEDLAYGINLANERYKEIEANFARYAAKSIADNDGIITSELEKAAALQGLAVQATETGGILVTQADKSTLASDRTKEQIDELAGAVGIGLSKEFVKSSASLNELVSGFDDLEKAGYDAGGALVDSLIAMSDKASNTVEIEALIVKWNELYKEGKITGQELADGLEGIERRANILKDGINGVTEAYGFLGLKTREELAKDAGAYTDAYNIVKKDGQATAQQLEEVFEKTAKANIAANKGVIDSVTAKMAAERGVTVAIDEQGRITFEKAGQAVTANDRIRTSVDRVATSHRSLASSAGAAGTEMVKAASRTFTAYEQLQEKIKGVKEAMALESGDETLRNLRIYGTEDIPTQGNQFGSKTAVENFLKSAGLSDDQAMEEVRKLYNKQGIRSGALNFGELQGYTDGEKLTTAELTKFKSASSYLLELAENIRYSQTNSSSSKIPESALQAQSSLNNKNYDTSATAVSGPIKTIAVQLQSATGTVDATIPATQESMFNMFLKQLGESKAISGQ